MGKATGSDTFIPSMPLLYPLDQKWIGAKKKYKNKNTFRQIGGQPISITS